MVKHSREDINVEELILTINLDKGLRAGLLELTADELTALLADIANSAKLSTAAFKKARVDLPSFCAVKWSWFSEQFSLPYNPSHLTLASFNTPRYHLPPSLQEAMFKNAWCWQDVYREKVDQRRKQARVRLLEPYIVPIVALFQGRVIDQPEQTMVETKYSTGGNVEHKIFMIGGILFSVIEFKLSTLSGDNLAQLFLELLSAAEQNKQLDFAGLHIYGLLTDLNQFKFYSYNPCIKKFCFDEMILICNKRVEAFSDMIDISNKIFGVILLAYMDGLRAIIKRSKDRGQNNDFSPEGSAPGEWIGQSTPFSSQKPSELTGEEKRGCKSTDQWEAALQLAECCVEKFNEPVASVQDIKAKANGVLELLTKSVRSIPRMSFFSGGDNDPSTPAELKALAADIIKKEHESYLSKIGQ